MRQKTTLPANVPITVADIIQAAGRIRQPGYLKPIAVERHAVLSERLQADIWIASETGQDVRSFKSRGALNNILCHPQATSYVCASAGNHAQGVAQAAKAVGKPAIIFMPAKTPEIKVKNTQLWGGEYATVRLIGETFDEAKEAALHYVNTQPGEHFVHPFDDRDTIIGQGTIAYELQQCLPQTPDMLFCTLGGGGLASGLSVFYHDRVIGVQPREAASMVYALHKGRPEPLTHIATTIDGAAVRQTGELTYRMVRDNQVSVVTVTDPQVEYAMQQLAHLRPEMAGAMSVAALLDADPAMIRGKTVVCIISGANINPAQWERIMSQPFEHFPKSTGERVEYRPLLLQKAA